MNTTNETTIFKEKKNLVLWTKDAIASFTRYAAINIIFLGTALFTVSSLIGLVLGIMTNDTEKRIYLICLVVSGIIILAMLVYGVIVVLLARRVQLYTITDRRITTREGAFTVMEYEIHAHQIERVTIQQSLLQKIVGAGTIFVASNNFTNIEIILEHINDPWTVYEKINTMRK